VPKVRQKEVEILTDEEIERIFATMNVDTVLGARNTAIYSLMLDTGLRLTEVVTLKYGDVHLDARYIKVLGKGDKERVVAFGTNCQRALTNYATRYRFESEGQMTDTFFLSIDGHCLSPLALRSLTQRLSKASGVPRLHPHLMRHTYATRFLLNGGNVFLLQQSLGHTTLAMVQNYVHIANRMAAQVNQDFSPLDHIRMQAPRRFRHSFNGDNWSSRIYPNAGRSRGYGAKDGNPAKKR
jgi:integrase/recombinase XerC/integrase/recombinase XerD